MPQAWVLSSEVGINTIRHALVQKLGKIDTLFIVEAMKTMNPIPAPRSGTIKEICVENGSPVEFGQTLLILG